MKMLFRYLVCVLALTSFMQLQGCGGGSEKSPVASTATSEEKSQICIECHLDLKSHVTGALIVNEWKLAAHNTANKASCEDCHGIDTSLPPRTNGCTACHPGQSFTHEARTMNPDKDGKCAKCHKSIPNHFASTANTASYLGSYNTAPVNKRCMRCHNPHDTSSAMPQLEAWARSGKGNTSSPSGSWTFSQSMAGDVSATTYEASYGFQCVRCHSTTGFLNFVKYRFVSSLPAGSFKEVLNCNACHVDVTDIDHTKETGYSYKIRDIGQFSSYFRRRITFPTAQDISEAISFPNVNASNLCLPCHTGRGHRGELIKSVLSGNFTNITFMDVHNYPAGLNLFGNGGYHFAGRTYNTNPTHASAGMSNLNGTGVNGPCVTCHMKPKRHTFKPVTPSVLAGADSHGPRLWKDTAMTAIVSTECQKCHTAAGAAMSVGVLNAKKANAVKTIDYLGNRLKTLGTLTAYDATARTLTAVTDWTTQEPGIARADLMGTVTNLVLLNNDPGAYVHNAKYMRQLLYDSIDAIDGGGLNYSTCTTVAADADAKAFLCANSTADATKINTAAERP